MDGPGMSLFQGAGSLHINNSAQERLDEQEELEDQKRREAELKHKLENAFDDLQDDDEASSINSSGNYTMNPGHSNGGHRIEGQEKKSGLPTYGESLNHLKEVYHPDLPKPYETPKSCQQQQIHMHNIQPNHHFSPFGAGDGQNIFLHRQEFKGHINGMNSVDPRQDLMNYEQLKLMYEMRVKECQQLAIQLEELRSGSDVEVNNLRVRLAACMSDKNKAELSLDQAQHLLASSKSKILEMEQQIDVLANKLHEGEQEKDRLKLELKSANISLQEAQQKFHTLQVAHTHDTDSYFREQQDRHREEVDRLHSDLQKAKNRLDEKENEIKRLENQCKERDREKEILLIEKATTINRLGKELEQAQNRLVNGETSKLNERVSRLTSERNTAREQVKELGSKLESTAQELALCRNKLRSVQTDLDNWRGNLKQILSECLPDNTYIGDPPSPGRLSTLKEILSRYKQQIQKVSSLQEELSKRDKKLEHHRKQETELRSKIEEQKGIELQLTSRLAVLQNKLELLGSNSDNDLVASYKEQNERLQRDLEECRADCKSLELKYTELEMDFEKLKLEKGGRATLVQEANADLLKELERYSAQLKDTLKKNGELKTLYLQACSTRDSIAREMKDLQSEMQKDRELYKSQEKEYIERLEKEKQKLEKMSSELSSNREELDRANKRISELQKEFTDKQKEFTSKLNKYLEDEKCSMRKELESCTQCDKNVKTIRNLEEQLHKCSIRIATQESNEELMKELKSKAEFFQKYILERFQKLQEQRNVATNTEDSSTELNGHTETIVQNDIPNDRCSDDDDFTRKTNLMIKEKEIREQIAQKFTLEIKTIEMNCTKRLKEMENEHINAVSKLKQLLEKKAQEVDTLKEFILMERSKVTQILNSKESEISELIRDHNSLQQEYQQLKDKAVQLKDRYQDKLKLIEDKYKNERESYKKNMTECDKEKQSLNNKLTQLDSEYQLLKTKYKNAKKTAYMYKDYVEKKDDHVTNELCRIQNEYKDIFMKLEGRIKFLVNCRVQETRNDMQGPSQRQESPQTDYSEMMHRLEDDITALARTRYEDAPALR